MPFDQTELDKRRLALRHQMEGYVNDGVDSFVRPELGPELAFEPLRPSIDAILNLLRHLTDAPLDVLPFHVLRSIETALGNVEARFSELKDFDVLALSKRGTNLLQHRKSILGNFEHSDAAFWDQITPAIGFLAAMKLEGDSSTTSAKQMLRRAAEVVATATAAGETLDQIVSAAREGSAKIGVSKHARLFAEEADHQEANARRWLKGTIVFTVLTLILAGLNVVAHVRGWESPTRGTDDQYRLDVGLVLAKTFAFSLLLSAIVWCGRIYKAARHNAVVNRHRQNALSTFQSFVEGGTDDQTRNAVLLQASQCVFAPQISGFVTGEPDGAGPTQMIEMVRTMSPQQR
jgi:hypothetical protein